MKLPLPHLEYALQRVYDVMARYKPSANWADGLDVRPSTDLQALMLPLDKIPLEVFNYYSWHSLTVTTDEEKKIAIRAFLPRFLRVYANESLGRRSFEQEQMRGGLDVCFEMVGDALRLYGMSTWRESESQPVKAFFSVWFLHLLQTPPHSSGHNPDANAVLAVAACAGVPVKPLLQQWSNQPLFPATLYQAELLIENANSLARDRDLRSWHVWGKEGAAPAEVRREAVQWLLSTTSLQRLEAAFHEANEEQQEQLSLAEQIYRSLV
ncbi:MAG: hypothetical protein FWD61_11750 [Phycisphaerales bacterium]|nr:hypothetical protein [Phycisphaerales bacterium]